MSWKDELEKQITEIRREESESIDLSRLEIEERDEVILPEEFSRPTKFDEMAEKLSHVIEEYIDISVSVKESVTNSVEISIKVFGETDEENISALSAIADFISINKHIVKVLQVNFIARIKNWLNHFTDCIINKIESVPKNSQRITEEMNKIPPYPFGDMSVKLERIQAIYKEVIISIIDDMSINIPLSIARYVYIADAFFVFVDDTVDADSLHNKTNLDKIRNEFGELPDWIK